MPPLGLRRVEGQGSGRHVSPPDPWNWRIPVAHRHASRCGRLIFVGAQADLDPLGNVRNGGNLAAQSAAALDNAERALECIDGRWSDVVKINVFHIGEGVEAEKQLLRGIRTRVRGPVPPVVTLVRLPRLAYPGMAVAIEVVAVDNSDGQAPRQVATPPGHRAWPRGAEFSHGLRCGELILVSGQSATDADGAVRHRDDIVAQARLTIENIGNVLAELGADLDDVVKLNTWYVGFGTDEDWRRAAQIRSGAFRFPGPGATGVPVPAAYPDGALLRQECWALRATDGARLPRSLSWPLGHWDWPIRVSFQQGVKIGETIFLGGQVALDPQGRTLSPGDMARQTEIVMTSIRDILAGFGAGLKDLIKVTCFYKSSGDPADLHANLAIRSGLFGGDGPATTNVPLENLGFEGVVLEVEGIAVAGGDPGQAAR